MGMRCEPVRAATGGTAHPLRSPEHLGPCPARTAANWSISVRSSSGCWRNWRKPASTSSSCTSGWRSNVKSWSSSRRRWKICPAEIGPPPQAASTGRPEGGREELLSTDWEQLTDPGPPGWRESDERPPPRPSAPARDPPPLRETADPGPLRPPRPPTARWRFGCRPRTGWSR